MKSKLEIKLRSYTENKMNIIFNKILLVVLNQQLYTNVKQWALYVSEYVKKNK